MLIKGVQYILVCWLKVFKRFSTSGQGGLQAIVLPANM